MPNPLDSPVERPKQHAIMSAGRVGISHAWYDAKEADAYMEALLQAARELRVRLDQMTGHRDIVSRTMIRNTKWLEDL